MNSSKTKTVNSSGLYLHRGSRYRTLQGEAAGKAARSLSSPLSARNTCTWLYVADRKGTSWLDKRRLRSTSSAMLWRLAAPTRQLAAALAGTHAGQWIALSKHLCGSLGIDWPQQLERGLAVVNEPAQLVCLEYDAFGRYLWLRADAQRAWMQLRAEARQDGIALQAISGWRSMHYQAQLLARKLARGQALQQILSVSAAPGFSEHHAGNAMDLACASDLALEERFESSAAFAWLSTNAQRFGWVMSLPRDNPFGYVYEPWHWRFER